MDSVNEIKETLRRLVEKNIPFIILREYDFLFDTSIIVPRDIDILAPDVAIDSIKDVLSGHGYVSSFTLGHHDFGKINSGDAPALDIQQGSVREKNLAYMSFDLAKKYEQIYAEHSGKIHKLILPADSPALQLLQRLRDEAHRFALAYHHRLRTKLIRESALDEISGLGALRKQKLLQHFGSLRALASAPEKEIANLPGIGAALAGKIKLFLNHHSPLGT